MKGTGLDLTVEGKLEDFLVVNIKELKGEHGPKFHLTQPRLIDSILEDLRLDGERVKMQDIPMASSKLLGRHKDSPDFDGHFNYRRVIGKLNFLEQSTHGNISYATHMCARFSTCPKLEHGKAVKWIGRYLKKTRKRGFIIKPDPSRGMEVHPDSDFAGAWDPAGAGKDVDTARSRHGFIISYCGVPLFWKSQMQTEVALSSTESEFIALATATRAAIPIQCILMEMKERGFPVVVDKNEIHCCVFEDNSGALAIAKLPKTRLLHQAHQCEIFPLVELGARARGPRWPLFLPQDRDRGPTRGCADQAPRVGVVCQAPQVVAQLVSGKTFLVFVRSFSLKVFACSVHDCRLDAVSRRASPQVPALGVVQCRVGPISPRGSVGIWSFQS